MNSVRIRILPPVLSLTLINVAVGASPVVAGNLSPAHSTVVILHGGIGMSVGGDLAENGGMGPSLRMAIRLPIRPALSCGIETGIVDLPPDETSRMFVWPRPSAVDFQIPVLAVLQVAGRAGRTSIFYAGAGAGATFNQYRASGGTDTHPTVSLRVGYTVQPWTSRRAVFDLIMIYEQQFIGSEYGSNYDARVIALGAGIGAMLR